MEARLIIRYSLYSLILIFLQISLFNYIEIGEGMFAAIYVLIILLLPIELHKAIPLILGFFIGFIIDIFNDTIAFNTGAMVMTAFARPFILHLLAPSDGYEIGKLPSLFNMGIKWFLIYTVMLLFLYQLTFHLFEIFTLTKLHIILLRTIINTTLSTFFILILHLTFFRNK